ncbi:hypothetical protein BB560_002820 [Smittium megazygosporum]|uniref:CMP/dCMP-type deaminase domain-containing protein n=1 Tax=Smittium megazygosporum TaxID=133381 RepID=A0A2T9ZDR3_9FUNG|nr:hypothetical protein BB560_002820 [Smittium megazygosporum]
MAVAEGKKCTSVTGAYNVGAVLVDINENKVVSCGYSRELEGNTHAEQCALEKYSLSDSAEYAMYTTMEPCSTRLSGKQPCVQRIISHPAIKKLYYCVEEPLNFVDCNGLELIAEAGIEIFNVDQLKREAEALNSHLIKN